MTTPAIRSIADAQITKTSKGFSIRTYEPPPADFNPLTASAPLLMRHGFPSRPDAQKTPELRKVWERAFSRPRTWITPEFKETEGKVHGPALRTGDPSRERVSDSPAIENATSSNWSGSVVLAPAGHTFGWLEGQWTVPNPHAPGAGSFYASEWIGIDGWASPDVLQAGTETEISNGVSHVYAWWEWYPAYEMEITNLSVSPGDVMYCLICVSSATTATVFISNESSRVTTSFTITAPAGTTLHGNSAEWIVERPEFNGLTRLTDYKVVYFDEGIAGLNDAETHTLGQGTPITMTGGGGAPLSVPTLETSQLMKVSWVQAS